MQGHRILTLGQLSSRHVCARIVISVNRIEYSMCCRLGSCRHLYCRMLPSIIAKTRSCIPHYPELVPEVCVQVCVVFLCVCVCVCLMFVCVFSREKQGRVVILGPKGSSSLPEFTLFQHVLPWCSKGARDWSHLSQWQLAHPGCGWCTWGRLIQIANSSCGKQALRTWAAFLWAEKSYRT